MSPYIVVAGSYVGNGTGQDVTFRCPPVFFYTRPVGATNLGGSIWHSAGYSSHIGFEAGSTPHLTFAEDDPTFVPVGGEDSQQQRYRIRIAGAHSQANANTVTYQYVALCDPGMRFSLAGTNLEKFNGAAHAHALVDDSFTPEFGFFHIETNGSNTTRRFYVKGAGQAVDTIAGYGGGTLNPGVTFGEGLLTFGTAINAVQGQVSYIVFRRADGNNDTEQAAALAFGSYTGDGNASRSINLAPATGKRPVWAIVVSEAATGAQRDPGHTGTNSSDTDGGADIATGITAGGVDSFTVGSTLNANGVVYSWFLLYGSATACNNGWACNGEFIHVETDADGGNSIWDPPPPEPEEEEGEGEGEPGSEFPGGPPVTPPDFSAACYAWSTYMVNLALARIGVSKQIADIRSDSSQEAYKARLIYAQDVETVLRDFPWPFATRYANLTLVAGTSTVPVNKDWQYSYRAPADIMRARRIINQEGKQRGYDPAPPQFRLGTDATGYLIYANAVSSSDIPVQLEYTIRMSCPAQQGDPLFRDALVWKLGRSLALSIARDNKKADWCEGMYQGTLVAAKEVAANESQPSLDQGDAPWILER